MLLCQRDAEFILFALWTLEIGNNIKRGEQNVKRSPLFSSAWLSESEFKNRLPPQHIGRRHLYSKFALIIAIIVDAKSKELSVLHWIAYGFSHICTCIIECCLQRAFLTDHTAAHIYTYSHILWMLTFAGSLKRAHILQRSLFVSLSCLHIHSPTYICMEANCKSGRLSLLCFETFSLTSTCRFYYS